MKVGRLAAVAATMALGGALLAGCGGSGSGATGAAAAVPGCAAAPAPQGVATSGAATGGVPSNVHAGFSRDEAAQAQRDWTPQRMASASPAPGATTIPSEFRLCDQSATQTAPASGRGASGGASGAAGGSSASPSSVPTPYQDGSYRIEGKLFALINSTTESECSATVIHSQGGNLVWTAAHCVHSGRGGSFFKEIVFVPDYNGNGTTLGQIAPLGVWSAKEADTSNGWVEQGQESANPGSFVDYAVVSFYPNARGQELENLTGRGATPGFDLPAQNVGSVTVAGYPAAAPYNGNTMYDCVSSVQQVSDPSLQGTTGTNPMWGVSCGMTAGASGGGWFASANGHEYLISNTSLGDSTDGLLLGPYFAGPSGHNAEALYQEAVDTFAPGPNPPSSVGTSAVGTSSGGTSPGTPQGS